MEFDDELLSLKLVKKTDIPEDEPISWMTFDVRILSCPHQNQTFKLIPADSVFQHAKKVIYGAAMKKWSSHAVKSCTDIFHSVSHPLAGHCMSTPADPVQRCKLMNLTNISSGCKPRHKYEGYFRFGCKETPILCLWEPVL